MISRHACDDSSPTGDGTAVQRASAPTSGQGPAKDDEGQDGRHYFRPETMALVDAVVDQEEVSPTMLMAS